MLKKLFIVIICTSPIQSIFPQIIVDKNSPVFKAPIPARYVQSSNVNLNTPYSFNFEKKPYFENTSKVITPSAGIPRGLIVLTTGSPREQTGIETRPLFQVDNKSLQAATPTYNPNNFSQYYPFSGLLNSFSKAHTDNQTAKLPNGDVLIVKEHCTWVPILRNPPKWINESILGEGGYHTGNRGAWSFFKVSAEGTEHKPELVSTLDLGVFEGGKYAYPQPSEGHWWIGGQDRSEIYACPYTGNIYLTCKFTSGPYKDYSFKGTLLLVSKDNAKTWKVVKEFLDGSEGIYAPMVMTSTPNKRLIIFSGYGSGGMELPRICYSKLASMGTDKIEMAGPYFVKVNDENGKLVNFQYNKETVDMFQNDAYFCSISRISESLDVMRSWVRVSVHMKNADNNLEAKIFKILIRDETNPPVATFMKTIKAENPKTNSVLYGSFIDPDPWEIPAPNSNLSAFYWVEAPKVNASPHVNSARFVLMNADKVSSPAYLSVKEKTGTARTWTTQQAVGDYFSGGFYYHNGHYNYFTQWMEPTGIIANVISIPLADVVNFSVNGF